MDIAEELITYARNFSYSAEVAHRIRFANENM